MDDKLLDEILEETSASFLRTGRIGSAILELAAAGFENPMVHAWQLDVLVHSHAEAVEEAINATYADLELARSAGSPSITTGPFPAEKVDEIVRKILDLNDKWGTLPPECFNAIADCAVRHATVLFARTEMWIPWEVAKADLESVLAEYHKHHPEEVGQPNQQEA